MLGGKQLLGAAKQRVTGVQRVRSFNRERLIDESQEPAFGPPKVGSRRVFESSDEKTCTKGTGALLESGSAKDAEGV